MEFQGELELGKRWPGRVFRLALIVGVLAVGAGAGYWFFLRDDTASSAPQKQEVATVTKGRLVSSLTTTGTAAASLSSKLTFQSAGQVKSVSVKLGDKVTAGQELARLDDRDALRKLDSAAGSLASAQLRLQQLQEPAKASDIATAEAQLAVAQANLDKAIGGPAAADIAAADASVTQAEASLQNANQSVTSNWTSLINAQRNYCQQAPTIVVTPCYETDLPLSDFMINALTQWMRAPGGSGTKVDQALAAANSLLQANNAYLSAKNGIPSAEKNVASAKAKRAALLEPPTAADRAQLEAAVISAQAKLDTLRQGSATATDIAMQQQSVKQAQISYQQAADAVDALVLKAPFAGTIGAATITVGDQVGAGTQVFVLTDTEAIRVDLAVSETDLQSVKSGQFGVATFDALPGQTYLVKVLGVSTTPTITQGVVTYQVQTQLLRGATLQENAQALVQVGQALGSLTGATFGGQRAGGARAAGSATAGAQGSQGQGGGTGRTPGAGGGGRPGANGTPGAGITPGAGGGGAGPGGLLATLNNAPIPAAGMNASVVLITEVKEDALLLPTAAVKRQGRQSFVLLEKADGTTEQRNVTVGGTDGSNTAIASGLNEGDKVLVSTPTTARATTTAAAGFGAGGFGAGGGDRGPGGGSAPGGVR